MSFLYKLNMNNSYEEHGSKCIIHVHYFVSNSRAIKFMFVRYEKYNWQFKKIN